MTSETEAGLSLDDQLCFAAYDASRAITAAYRSGLAGLGLTYTQYVVLLVLWERDELPMTQLCARLHLDSATLSPVLKRMADRGLLTRERPVADERTVLLRCTEQGRALLGPVSEVQARVEAATGLDTAELARLRAELHRVAARLRQDQDREAASG